MTRNHVFQVISVERENQKLKWGSDDGKTVSCFINDIEHKLNQAKVGAYERNNNEAVYRIMQIAALATACLEHLGGEDLKETK